MAILGLDIETDGKEANSNLVSIQVWDSRYQKGYFYDCRSAVEKEIAKQVLKDNEFVAFFSLFDLYYLKKDLGLAPLLVGDASILASLSQQPTNCRSLDDLSQKFLGKSKLGSLSVVTDGFRFFFDREITSEMVEYGIQDARLAYELEEVMKFKLMKDEEWFKVYKLELLLVPVLIEMRLSGLKIDEDSLKLEIKNLEDRSVLLKNELFEEAGHPFRLNARADLMNVLFNEMKFEQPPVRTEKGALSVNAEALSYFDHIPFVNKLVEAKHCESVLSSQKDIWDNLVDGYIHPEFRPVGYDASSRVYTSKPSANQMPRELRRAVVPDSGKKFIYIDWSGAELMLLAYSSGQLDLVAHYESGGDPHRFVVSKMLSKQIDSISDEEREISKVVTFSIVYGSEGDAASRRLKIERDKGKELVAKFFEVMPKIKVYLDSLILLSKKTGYAKTIFGRKRRLEGVFSSSSQDVQKAERRALNTPIQSGVADLMKWAMIRIASNMPTVTLKFIVFDSFLFEVDEAVDVASLVPMFKKCFLFNIGGQKIQFNFKLKEGHSWGHLME